MLLVLQYPLDKDILIKSRPLKVATENRCITLAGQDKLHSAGCKENQFLGLAFRQAVTTAIIYSLGGPWATKKNYVWGNVQGKVTTEAMSSHNILNI